MALHERRAGAYILIRLVNDSEPLDYTIEPKGEAWYGPTSIRKMGRR